MSRGYLMCSPLLLINMGGEMMYILEQRLSAQKVTPEKAIRILNDSAKTLFSAQFIEQLFEPQRTFSVHYTRQIFTKVVHSSIMTLNESSMNKVTLYLTPPFIITNANSCLT